MTGFITSYVGMFDGGAGSSAITRVQIPLIQRDYAQGRTDRKTERIRRDFLATLHDALAGDEPLGLDFVYGDLKDDGTFKPLDGQQRLTTLFLLHWYLAFRTEKLTAVPSWGNFTYATRESARVFCERIVASPPPADVVAPATWIQDQPWYRFQWRHDPTIQSMLQMIASIADRFADLDPHVTWAKLADPERPAIFFHVLPVKEMGAGDELYIKMNSRGKPLTDFETFKARFEKWIEGSNRELEFAEKVDGKWADLLWPFDTGDNTVDDEFMKYFSYLTQLQEWLAGVDTDGSYEDRAREVFSTGRPNAEVHLGFLFDAFDRWDGVDVASWFSENFTTSREPGKLHLFTTSEPNLLKLCCHSFGTSAQFGNAEALLLYGALLHRIHDTDDFATRVRILRNLVVASQDEIRPENLGKLAADVRVIIVNGDLTAVTTFNTAQVEDETLKQDFVTAHPELRSTVQNLEDHDILRGSLMVFELDAERLPDHASRFAALMANSELWTLLTGALLTQGDYSRPNHPAYPDKRQFGSPSMENRWRLLLTGASRANLAKTRAALAGLLDALPESPAAGDLDTMTETWTTARVNEGELDWRYYLARYDTMREGKTGLYAAPKAVMGFDLRMLDKKILSSRHREPYVYAAWKASGIDVAAADPWFLGYEPNGCWLTLVASAAGIRCVDEGWKIRVPDGARSPEVNAILAKYKVDDTGLLRVPQVVQDDRRYDTVDRIVMAAELLKDLVGVGL
jgi:hypothetical protein